MKECWLKRFDPETPCSGRWDPIHLIPKQRVIRERPEVDSWDERLIVEGCRGHHIRFDLGDLSLSFEDYPPKLLAFAQEQNFFYDESRDSWIAAKQTTEGTPR